MERYILLDTLKQYPLELQNFSDEIQDDEELVRLAVKKNGLALQYASKRLKNDYETVMLAVTKNGLGLEFASSDLKNHKNIVLSAVKSDGAALQFVPEALKNDREVILYASKNCKVEYIPETFLYDFEIIENLISNDAVVFADLPEEIRRDTDFILMAISRDISMMLYVPDDVLANKETVLELIEASNLGDILYYSDEDLKKNREVVLAAMRYGGLWTYSELPEEMRCDTEVMRTLVDNIDSYVDSAENFSKFFSSYDISNELMEDDTFISKVAELLNCSDICLELNHKEFVLRIIELDVCDTDNVCQELLDDPEVQASLSKL